MAAIKVIIARHIFDSRGNRNIEVDVCLSDGTLARDVVTSGAFDRYHTEHELLRYIHRLQSKDLSLCHSMIPLGSCAMKLNATVETMPVTWPEFANINPFAPTDQAMGYQIVGAGIDIEECELHIFHC